MATSIQSRVWLLAVYCYLLTTAATSWGQTSELLPNTEPLTEVGDLASLMVERIDHFLLQKLDDQRKVRRANWEEIDSLSHPHAKKSLDHLSRILGLRDERPENPNIQLVQSVDDDAELARTGTLRVLRVRWPAISNRLGEIHGEGLLLQTLNQKASKLVIAIPDCEQSPESVVKQYGRFATNDCDVLILSLISRRIEDRRSQLTNREYLHRSSFELGRQLAGYELQKVFALIDWFESRLSEEVPQEPKGLAVVGYGEGARLALFASALDPRIDVVCCSGYVGKRERVWKEPLDRNVFGQLNDFADTQLIQAALLQRTDVIIDPSRAPVAEVRTRGGAPYSLTSPTPEEVRELVSFAKAPENAGALRMVPATSGTHVSETAMAAIVKVLKSELRHSPKIRELPNDETREARQIREIEQYNHALLTESHYTRIQYFKDHDRSSLESHERTIEKYRDRFRADVIGQFDDQRLPLRPRSRRVFNEEKWTGYEVVLDVFDSPRGRVFAYGILLLPKNLAEGERRPVIVCQHGLEGRPRNVIEKDHPAYHDYAAKLAEQGFITFAPQNIYIFEDRFRSLQRKANPLGKTLFSIMVPQHQQIVDWLATLPQVDPERIAFYGLSYGGKSAMRIPPLVDRYCLSICSADFNDWVWKNASTRSPYSYVWSGEYEIFEWDLGSTFNYAEMAALIAPRPFMVERGHFDGVAPDERVALEFAKVRNLYQAKLGIGDRCEIEFFVGPHTINGKGTFAFLRRHLSWPNSDE